MADESSTIKVQKITGSVLGVVGFLLSPLSWWNDLVLNIPLSYLGATFTSYLVPGHFSMFLIGYYWLTNVAGLILMHKGGSLFIQNTEQINNSRTLIKDLTISLVYTLILTVLVVTHVLKLPQEYFTSLK